MGIHSSSVIATRIGTFDAALYTAITDKEEEIYDNGTNGRITEVQPQFQALNDAIETWMDSNREDAVFDLVTGLYSYKVMGDLFGTSLTLISSSDADDIFDMDGYRARIKTDILAYYDDYPTIEFKTTGNKIVRDVGSFIDEGFTDGMSITVGGSSSNDGVLTVSTSGVSALELTVDEALTNEGPSGFITVTGTGSVAVGGAKLVTDRLLIAAAFAGQEASEIAGLLPGYQAGMRLSLHNQLFVDVAPLTTLSKDAMNTFIFTTLNYRVVYDNLNVGSLTAPAAP